MHFVTLACTCASIFQREPLLQRSIYTYTHIGASCSRRRCSGILYSLFYILFILTAYKVALPRAQLRPHYTPLRCHDHHRQRGELFRVIRLSPAAAGIDPRNIDCPPLRLRFSFFSISPFFRRFLRRYCACCRAFCGGDFFFSGKGKRRKF